MSPLWVLPLLVVSGGVALVALVVRGLASAATDLAHRSAQLAELGDEAATLRGDVDAMAARARSLRWRRGAAAGDR